MGLLVIAVLALLAAIAPLIAPHDPMAIDPARKLAGPSSDFWLGTDNLGRDIFSRLLYGSRLSMGTAVLATLAIVSIGVPIGAVSGYFGGLIDDAIMRVVEVLLAFPSLILALAIIGVMGPGMTSVMAGLVAVWWVGYARIIRGSVLSLRERQFIEAAKAIGASNPRIIFLHLLPNVIGPVIVLATLELGTLLLAISGLSFLGLGAQPPTPEWGSMLNDGRRLFISAPQLMLYPGAAISLAVLGFNLLGDGLRDVLDPRLKG